MVVLQRALAALGKRLVNNRYAQKTFRPLLSKLIVTLRAAATLEFFILESSDLNRTFLQ